MEIIAQVNVWVDKLGADGTQGVQVRIDDEDIIKLAEKKAMNVVEASLSAGVIEIEVKNTISL